MKHILSLYLIMLLCCPKADAKVELPEIIGDHMVLQQNSNVKLWGKAKKNAQIEVSASWNILTFTTKAGEDGKWTVTIPTPQAGYAPQEIVISDGEATTLKKHLDWRCVVLFGTVEYGDAPEWLLEQPHSRITRSHCERL